MPETYFARCERDAGGRCLPEGVTEVSAPPPFSTRGYVTAEHVIAAQRQRGLPEYTQAYAQHAADGINYLRRRLAETREAALHAPAGEELRHALADRRRIREVLLVEEREVCLRAPSAEQAAERDRLHAQMDAVHAEGPQGGAAAQRAIQRAENNRNYRAEPRVKDSGESARVQAVLARAAQYNFLKAAGYSDGRMSSPDSPHTWVVARDGTAENSFKLADGSVFRVFVEGGHGTVSFVDRHGSTGRTGDVGALSHEVFTHVSEAMTAYVKDRQPEQLKYSAMGPSRVRLYTLMTKVLLRAAPEYKAYSDGHWFYVVKAEHVKSAFREQTEGGYFQELSFDGLGAVRSDSSDPIEQYKEILPGYPAYVDDPAYWETFWDEGEMINFSSEKASRLPPGVELAHDVTGQPRDYHGRWSPDAGDGGGGVAVAERAAPPAASQATPPHTERILRDARARAGAIMNDPNPRTRLADLRALRDQVSREHIDHAHPDAVRGHQELEHVIDEARRQVEAQDARTSPGNTPVRRSALLVGAPAPAPAPAASGDVPNNVRLARERRDATRAALTAAQRGNDAAALRIAQRDHRRAAREVRVTERAAGLRAAPAPRGSRAAAVPDAELNAAALMAANPRLSEPRAQMYVNQIRAARAERATAKTQMADLRRDNAPPSEQREAKLRYNRAGGALRRIERRAGLRAPRGADAAQAAVAGAREGRPIRARGRGGRANGVARRAARYRAAMGPPRPRPGAVPPGVQPAEVREGYRREPKLRERDPNAGPGARAQAILDLAAQYKFVEGAAALRPRTTAETNRTWKGSDFGGHRLEFKLSDGARFTIRVDSGGGTAFTDGRGQYGRTGNVGGLSHEVFTNVTAAMAAYVREKQPRKISFTASGESRVRLYAMMTKMLLRTSPGYYGFSDGHEFDVVKADSKAAARNEVYGGDSMHTLSFDLPPGVEILPPPPSPLPPGWHEIEPFDDDLDEDELEELEDEDLGDLSSEDPTNGRA